jgi:hypothetical protein
LATDIATITTTNVPPVTAPTLTPSERRHLSALEKRIERGLQTFKEVGAALMEVRDSRLYREDWPSFEAYCQARWQMERQRAYQLIGAVEVVEALPEATRNLVRNEATARELVPIMREDPEVLKTVWARVAESATETGKPVMAETVRMVKAEVLPGRTTANVMADLQTRLITEANRLKAIYTAWLATGPDRKERRNVDSAIRAITQV